MDVGVSPARTNTLFRYKHAQPLSCIQSGVPILRLVVQLSAEISSSGPEDQQILDVSLPQPDSRELICSLQPGVL